MGEKKKKNLCFPERKTFVSLLSHLIDDGQILISTSVVNVFWFKDMKKIWLYTDMLLKKGEAF